METSMATTDRVCTLAPYFKVNEGKMGEFKSLCEKFVAKTRSEPKCVHYAFSFSGDAVHCREGYDDAAGLLAHLDNVGALLQEALKIAQITRLEVHGPADELDKLRAPMANLKPQWFSIEYGIRR
jgi:quinol monooxygenase YgiN